MPEAPEHSAARPKSGLSRRALLLIGAAFGIGLLLFLLLWLGERGDDEFFRAGPASTDRQGQEFEPLPMPDAVGSNDAMPASTPPEGTGVEQPPSPAEIIEPADPAPLPPPVAQAPSSTPPPAAAGPDASARPVHSPPPRYPRRAMRRGESGTVLLQVQVDASGRPRSVDVVQSSRSRDLDREAVRAVERWRFSPATRGGRAVPSKVLVPIEFDR